MPQRHQIQFPPTNHTALSQAEAYFYLIEGDQKNRLRLHDYCEIYSRPKLYEQLFYDRLKCSSPDKVGEILRQALDATGAMLSELRVLDLGAGNGMMGEVLKSYGVSRLVGVDIIPAARDAAWRDRPSVYDEYYVADFTHLDADTHQELCDWSFDCLTSVAALGFGDIPPRAFSQALSFVRTDGWVAFNIKETFLDRADDSGFSRLIREMIAGQYLEVHHMERYQHRLSMEGTPLFYFALVAKKSAQLPDDFLVRHGIEEVQPGRSASRQATLTATS